MAITITLTDEDAQDWVRNRYVASMQPAIEHPDPWPAMKQADPPLAQDPELAFGSVPSFELPPAPPATTGPGIEVDSQGLPWDGRIHASSRAKVSDGTWRLKRNVEPDLITAVIRELKVTMGLPVVANVPQPPVQLAPTVEPVIEVPPPPFVPSVVPPAPPASITTGTESAGAVAGASHSSVATFPALMKAITAAFAAKTLDQAKIQSAVQAAGLPSLPMLAARPDLVQTMATLLGIAL